MGNRRRNATRHRSNHYPPIPVIRYSNKHQNSTSEGIVDMECPSVASHFTLGDRSGVFYSPARYAEDDDDEDEESTTVSQFQDCISVIHSPVKARSLIPAQSGRRIPQNGRSMASAHGAYSKSTMRRKNTHPSIERRDSYQSSNSESTLESRSFVLSTLSQELGKSWTVDEPRQQHDTYQPELLPVSEGVEVEISGPLDIQIEPENTEDADSVSECSSIGFKGYRSGWGQGAFQAWFANRHAEPL